MKPKMRRASWWVAEGGGGMITVEENVQGPGITVSISQAPIQASAVVCVHVWSHACAHVSPLHTRNRRGGPNWVKFTWPITLTRTAGKHSKTLPWQRACPSEPLCQWQVFPHIGRLVYFCSARPKSAFALQPLTSVYSLYNVLSKLDVGLWGCVNSAKALPLFKPLRVCICVCVRACSTCFSRNWRRERERDREREMSDGAKKGLIMFVETCLGVWWTVWYTLQLERGALTSARVQKLEWRAGEVDSRSFDSCACLHRQKRELSSTQLYLYSVCGVWFPCKATMARKKTRFNSERPWAGPRSAGKKNRKARQR